MRVKFILLIMCCIGLGLKLFCLPGNAVYEQYDQILAKSYLAVPKEINETNTKPRKKYILKYDHHKLPNLEGTWRLTKTTSKRIINPVIKRQSLINHCNSRLPFEQRDFKNKEVIISAQGPDFFRVASKYPDDYDIYLEPDYGNDAEHHNFGLKAVIDPKDLTYAYTLRLQDYLDNPSLPKQVWLNGRLKYKSVSRRRIVAEGYEIEDTPECLGFLIDHTKFVFIRKGPDKGEGRKIETLILPEEKEIIGVEKPLSGISLESAEDKSGFKPALIYRPLDSKNTKVPGLW